MRRRTNGEGREEHFSQFFIAASWKFDELAACQEQQQQQLTFTCNQCTEGSLIILCGRRPDVSVFWQKCRSSAWCTNSNGQGKSNLAMEQKNWTYKYKLENYQKITFEKNDFVTYNFWDKNKNEIVLFVEIEFQDFFSVAK